MPLFYKYVQVNLFMKKTKLTSVVASAKGFHFKRETHKKITGEYKIDCKLILESHFGLCQKFRLFLRNDLKLEEGKL